MRRLVLGVVMAALAATATGGCGAPLILENAATRQRVNCTVEALRLAQSGAPDDSTGKDVPRHEPMSPSMTRLDYERQCKGNLERDGFVCVSGC
jgi:hypothetical protein